MVGRRADMPGLIEAEKDDRKNLPRLFRWPDARQK
jgi:hypothetical protein